MGFKPLTAKEVILLHDMLVERYGGATGLRDRSLLEAALSRAESRLAYGGAEPGSPDSIGDATVAVAAGIVSSHPFVDGNRRTALIVVRSLTNLNDVDFSPPVGEEADAMVKLASGEWSEEALKDWVAKHSVMRANFSGTIQAPH